ncbi:MAG: hypothetical protein ACRC7N_13570 [Clostridium sp.]
MNKENKQNTNNENKKEEIQAPKKVKYQCLHTTETKECTCIRSKGMVLVKN